MRSKRWSGPGRRRPLGVAVPFSDDTLAYFTERLDAAPTRAALVAAGGALDLTIERLYRLRYLHRGPHAPNTPIQFLRRLRLSLAVPVLDTG